MIHNSHKKPDQLMQVITISNLQQACSSHASSTWLPTPEVTLQTPPLQVRVFVLLPPGPQVTEQADQLLQADQAARKN